MHITPQIPLWLSKKLADDFRTIQHLHLKRKVVEYNKFVQLFFLTWDDPRIFPMVRANNVFPLPGGPWNRTPFTWPTPTWRNTSSVMSTQDNKADYTHINTRNTGMDKYTTQTQHCWHKEGAWQLYPLQLVIKRGHKIGHKLLLENFN